MYSYNSSKMRAFWALSSIFLYASATILENGQPRLNPYPGQAQLLSPVGNFSAEWKTYDADASQISYKGRWDEQHISCKYPPPGDWKSG